MLAAHEFQTQPHRPYDTCREEAFDVLLPDSEDAVIVKDGSQGNRRNALDSTLASIADALPRSMTPQKRPIDMARPGKVTLLPSLGGDKVSCCIIKDRISFIMISRDRRISDITCFCYSARRNRIFRKGQTNSFRRRSQSPARTWSACLEGFRWTRRL